jgi:hypothetical protein
MKTSLTIFILLATLASSAQVIPWASQQPEWVFPLIFENGDQNVDTVYLAYAINSSDIQGMQSDTIYGEEWITVDTAAFHAYFTKCCNSFADTVIKASVTNATDQLSGTITLENVILPLIMRWDVSLLRNNNLPFPAHGTAPYAEGIVNYGGSVLYLGPDSNLCPPLEPLFITDSIFSYVDGCLREDTAVFFDYLNIADSNLTTSIEINIREWGVYTNVEEEQLNQHPKFYPNPTSSFIHLSFGSEKFKMISIYNNLGVLIEVVEEGKSSVDLSSYTPGVYIIHSKDINNVQSITKIIKAL